MGGGLYQLYTAFFVISYTSHMNITDITRIINKLSMPAGKWPLHYGYIPSCLSLSLPRPLPLSSSPFLPRPLPLSTLFSYTHQSVASIMSQSACHSQHISTQAFYTSYLDTFLSVLAENVSHLHSNSRSLLVHCILAVFDCSCEPIEPFSRQDQGYTHDMTRG